MSSQVEGYWRQCDGKVFVVMPTDEQAAGLLADYDKNGVGAFNSASIHGLKGLLTKIGSGVVAIVSQAALDSTPID